MRENVRFYRQTQRDGGTGCSGWFGKLESAKCRAVAKFRGSVSKRPKRELDEEVYIIEHCVSM